MARNHVQYAAHVRGARGRFAQARPEIVAKFRSELAQDVEANFDQSRSPEGVIWPALKYRQGKPLILIGRLKASSVRAAEAAQVKGNVIEARIASSRVQYGRFQQFGTSTIPKRKFFGMRPGTTKKLANYVAKLGARAFKG